MNGNDDSSQAVAGAKSHLVERHDANVSFYQETPLGREQTSQRVLSFLNQVIQAALVTTDLQTMLQISANQLGELFFADGCFITLWDEAAQQPIPLAAYGPLHEKYISIQIQPGEATVTAALYKTRHPLVIEDIYNTPYLSQRLANMLLCRSLLGLPLIVDSRFLGAILITFNEAHQFSDIEVEQGKMAASTIALAMVKARLHEDLQGYATVLEEQIAERTRESSLANNRLKELNLLMTTFVQEVSLELRSPITNLRLYLELLEHCTPEKRAYYLSLLKEQANLLSHLVENTLNLSRLEGDRLVKGFIPVDINQIVHQVVVFTKQKMKSADYDLRLELDENLPYARGLPSQLMQLVMNLIQNAMNYTLVGWIKVITSFHSDISQISLTVQDTGIGIPHEDIPHIFNRFYRGQTALASGKSGSGLGLAIVKNIIEHHDGSIEVESDINQGTTFRIFLPLW